jgi:hypothetical protein
MIRNQVSASPGAGSYEKYVCRHLRLYLRLHLLATICGYLCLLVIIAPGIGTAHKIDPRLQDKPGRIPFLVLHQWR